MVALSQEDVLRKAKTVLQVFIASIFFFTIPDTIALSGRSNE